MSIFGDFIRYIGSCVCVWASARTHSFTQIRLWLCRFDCCMFLCSVFFFLFSLRLFDTEIEMHFCHVFTSFCFVYFFGRRQNKIHRMFHVLRQAKDRKKFFVWTSWQLSPTRKNIKGNFLVSFIDFESVSFISTRLLLLIKSALNAIVKSIKFISILHENFFYSVLFVWSTPKKTSWKRINRKCETKRHVNGKCNFEKKNERKNKQKSRVISLITAWIVKCDNFSYTIFFFRLFLLLLQI